MAWLMPPSTFVVYLSHGGAVGFWFTVKCRCFTGFSEAVAGCLDEGCCVLAKTDLSEGLELIALVVAPARCSISPSWTRAFSRRETVAGGALSSTDLISVKPNHGMTRDGPEDVMGPCDRWHSVFHDIIYKTIDTEINTDHHQSQTFREVQQPCESVLCRLFVTLNPTQCASDC